MPRVTQRTSDIFIEDVEDKVKITDQDDHSRRKRERQSLGRNSVGLPFHLYHTIIVFRPEVCILCGRKINTKELAAKCDGCKIICHTDCLGELPIPYTPLPGSKNGKGTITDFIPETPPLVPALIQCAVTEIETRCRETVLYRFYPKEEEINELMELYIQGDIPWNRNEFDVHVLCGAVKAFFERLTEPLITRASGREFLRATTLGTLDSCLRTCCQLIWDLPQANRETLAFLILHIKKLLRIKKQKLDVRKVAKIFSSFLFGQRYCCKIGGGKKMTKITKAQQKVVQLLLIYQTEFWSEILGEIEETEIDNEETENPEEEACSESDDTDEEMSLPKYEMIVIPSSYFKYAVNFENEESLNNYINLLTSDDDVPFMLTEYINDEVSRNRVRQHLYPEMMPFYVRKQILKKQPEFAPYF